MYSDEIKKMCVDKKLQTAPCGPHVFAMSEKAYVQLKTSEKKVGKLQSQVRARGARRAHEARGERAAHAAHAGRGRSATPACICFFHASSPACC